MTDTTRHLSGACARIGDLLPHPDRRSLLRAGSALLAGTALGWAPAAHAQGIASAAPVTTM